MSVDGEQEKKKETRLNETTIYIYACTPNWINKQATLLLNVKNVRFGNCLQMLHYHLSRFRAIAIISTPSSPFPFILSFPQTTLILYRNCHVNMTKWMRKYHMTRAYCWFISIKKIANFFSLFHCFFLLLITFCTFYAWQINYYVCKWQNETIIFTKIQLRNAAAFKPIKIYVQTLSALYIHAIQFICFFFYFLVEYHQ